MKVMYQHEDKLYCKSDLEIVLAINENTQLISFLNKNNYKNYLKDIRKKMKSLDENLYFEYSEDKSYPPVLALRYKSYSDPLLSYILIHCLKANDFLKELENDIFDQNGQLNINIKNKIYKIKSMTLQKVYVA